MPCRRGEAGRHMACREAEVLGGVFEIALGTDAGGDVGCGDPCAGQNTVTTPLRLS